MAKRTDSERLDWLEQNEVQIQYWDETRSIRWANHQWLDRSTLRAAIDAAMDQELED